MKILVIAPHMDDEVLGCGGTIARHVENGDDLSVCFIANRIYDHKFDGAKNDIEKQHAENAHKVLGYNKSVFLGMSDERLDACIQDIIIPLEKFMFKVEPEIVYCPFRGDNNQDHRAVFDAVRIVTRPSVATFIKKLFMYEVPSSTEQSPPLHESAFLSNYYVDITNHIDIKIKAYKCYETEMRHYPHPRSEDALKVHAQKRGIEIGLEYAEAFIMLRDMWK